MNDFALFYIIYSIFASVFEFIRHWYVNGFYVWKHQAFKWFERTERIFAFRINVRYFGEPLFQDRTVVGYILGFIFRTSWIVIGGLFYLFLWPFAFLLYVVWCLAPLYAVFRIIIG